MTSLATKNCITLVWRIENFSYFSPQIYPNGIDSPFFTLRCNKLCLYLIPEGENIPITLKLKSSNNTMDYPINVEWSLLDFKGFSFVAKTQTNLFLKRNEVVWIFYQPELGDEFVTRRSEFLSEDTLTVQLRIWKKSGDFACEAFLSGRSCLKVEEESFMWSVAGFSDLPLRKEVYFPNPSQWTQKHLRWKLTLTGDTLQEAGVDIEVIAERVDKKLPTTVKLYVLDNEYSPMTSMHFIRTFSEGELLCAVPKFLTRRELMDQKAVCLKNGVLTMLCKTFLPHGNISTWIDSCFSGPQSKQVMYEEKSIKRNTSEASCQTASDAFGSLEDSAHTLEGDLMAMYQDQILTDFKLCSGGVSFPVHKNILSARSPVFKTMFSSGLKESSSNSLDIPDLDSHTLNRLLTFLYTGLIEQDLEWESVVKLYYAADKYEVLALKHQCSSLLTIHISISSLTDILSLADKHEDLALLSSVHDFILSHYEDVMCSTEWENFLEAETYLAGKTAHVLFKRKFQHSNKK